WHLTDFSIAIPNVRFEVQSVRSRRAPDRVARAGLAPLQRLWFWPSFETRRCATLLRMRTEFVARFLWRATHSDLILRSPSKATASRRMAASDRPRTSRKEPRP